MTGIRSFTPCQNGFSLLDFRPAIISMAELKFPVFQQVSATRRRQDSTACRSSTVAPLVIAWVTHELTSLKRSMRICTVEHTVATGQAASSSVWVELLAVLGLLQLRLGDGGGLAGGFCNVV